MFWTIFFHILFICMAVGGSIMLWAFSQHGDSTLWKYKKLKWIGLGLLILGSLGEIILILKRGAS